MYDNGLVDDMRALRKTIEWHGRLHEKLMGWDVRSCVDEQLSDLNRESEFR